MEYCRFTELEAGADANVWNRLNVPTKKMAGHWVKSDEAREWRRKQAATD
jgi:hypothetical protein